MEGTRREASTGVEPGETSRQSQGYTSGAQLVVRSSTLDPPRIPAHTYMGEGEGEREGGREGGIERGRE